MSQNKLQRLAKHLIDARYQGRKLAHAEQFDCFIEGGRIEPENRVLNANRQILGATIHYSGTISINPCYAPAELVATYVSFWLQNNADKNDSVDAEFTWDKTENGENEIEITIEHFSDEITLVESDTGPFELNGKTYALGEASTWVANNFVIDVDICREIT